MTCINPSTQAAAKIEKQLRRYKRRIKDRHEQAAHALREEEAAYTIWRTRCRR